MPIVTHRRFTAAPRPAFDVKPMITFDASQNRFFRDTARVIVVNWHRQKGKDFTAAAKAVDDCIATKRDWFIVSLTQRQADATFAKCKAVFAAFREMIKIKKRRDIGEAREGAGWEFKDTDKEINESFVAKARELILPGGGRVISLPGKDPDTLAGLTGNVIFTEFGLFPGGGYAHWRVVFPLCTRGFSVIVISTPRSKSSKFFELWNDPKTYSVHTCNIEQSIEHDGFVLKDKDGNACTLEQFKKLYGDDVGWEREYMCNFTGDLVSLIKWAQLLAAAELGEKRPFNLMRIEGEAGFDPLFFASARDIRCVLDIGWDVARTGDLASVWVNISTGAYHDASNARRETKALRYLVIMHNTPFALQRRIVQGAMDARGFGSGVGCGDATGLGMSDNEALTAMYGERWEGVNFGGPRKSELAAVGLTAYRDGAQAIPSIAEGAPYKFIGTDVYAVQRVTDAEGKEDELEKRLKITEGNNALLLQSHCDIAYSNFLSLRAGAKGLSDPLPPPLAELPEAMV